VALRLPPEIALTMPFIVHRIPPAAAWLGAAGLLPFLGLALAALILGGAASATALRALLAYGAVILSFLGGIHWGLAIAAPATQRLTAWLCLSIIPSLLAWVALLLPAPAGLLLLAASIAAMLLPDRRATASGQAPAWYPALRLPLSAAAAISLLAATLA
jgi:hypothetical protein